MNWYRRWKTPAIWCALAPLVTTLFVSHVAAQPQSPLAARLLRESGVTGGIILHLHCGDGSLTAQLRPDNRFQVQGLSSDREAVAAARRRIQAEGLYGPITIELLRGEALPYDDNLVNLVIAERLGEVPLNEIMRVLVPGGVAYLQQEGAWVKRVKSWPRDIDQWTHYLHDASGNAVAADSQIGHPKHLRWLAGPDWSRSHEFNPSLNALVSGGGRMFYIYDEGILGLPDLRFPARWVLMARDAFNGKLLWKRPVPNWGYREWNTVGMWSAPLTLNRRVVTDGERVYVTPGYSAPVSVLDAATGKEIRTLAATRGTDEMVLSDGVLLLVVREHLSVAVPPKKRPNVKNQPRRNPHEYTIGAPGLAELVGIHAETGRELWRRKPEALSVLTLAATQGRACYHAGDEITSIDLQTGNTIWTTKSPGTKGSRYSVGTLVMWEGQVFFTSRNGLVALSAEDGSELWTGPRVTGPGISHPPDLFVADGLVWGGDIVGTHTRERTLVRREGRDPKTGEVKRTIEIPDLISPLHHFRCYRSKATEDFLLLTKRGVEFVDLDGQDHTRCDWLRAMCHYGFLPCNGLLYIPPHHCFCYPGVKLNGFMAFASSSEADKSRGEYLDSELTEPEHGPAFDTVEELSAVAPRETDWPTYRQDPGRRGSTKCEVSAELEQAWQVEFAGKLTPPVAAAGRLYIAEKETHRLFCVDGGTGKRLWDVTAGARIDSPPTVSCGLVFFGCRDGWVYALRADTGEEVWRFRAAPRDLRIVAHGQFESPWPVTGSVLVLDDIVYCVAGRSSYLDGGLILYGLDPRSGRPRYRKQVENRWPDVETETGRPFDMEGTKSDILVTDGDHIFLYQMAFDKELNDVTGERVTALGDRYCGRHLIATNGFLEDCWYDRTYWTYSNRWPGFYYANAAPKTGQILVVDDNRTYGLHVFVDRARLSPSFQPGTGYSLFADDNENDPVLTERSAGREKGPGFSRAAPPIWATKIPLRARAMVLAQDKLFMAGPPDVVPEDDAYASFDGRLGAQLWVVAAADGKKLAEYSLKAIPAFDGLIAANHRLYMTTERGTLQCWRPR